MNELEQLATSDKGWAAARAAMALQFSDLRKQEKISESEYQELLEDLVRSDTLDKEADDIKTKALLISAISALSKMA